MGTGLTMFALPAGSVTVSAAELRRNFGVWQERAFANPVVVVRHGKPRLVLSSAAEFFSEAQAPQDTKEAAVLSACAGIPDHSTEALLVMNREMRVLAVNRIFEDLAGRHASNLIGRTGPELFAAGCEPIVSGHFRHALQTGAPVQFEIPAAMVEGRHYGFSVFPHADGIAALIVNRTTEAALREELETYRSLTAGVALAVNIAHARLNLRGMVEEASPQFGRMLGLDPTARFDIPFPEMIVPEVRAQTVAILDRVMSGAAATSLATAFIGKGGEAVQMTASLAPIWRGPLVKGVTVVIQLA